MPLKLRSLCPTTRRGFVLAIGYILGVYCLTFLLMMDLRGSAFDPESMDRMYDAEYRFAGITRISHNLTMLGPKTSLANVVYWPLDRLVNCLFPDYNYIQRYGRELRHQHPDRADSGIEGKSP